MALTREQSQQLAQHIRTNFVAAYTRTDLYKVAELREDHSCSEGEALYLFVKEKFENIPLPDGMVIAPLLNGNQSKSPRRNPGNSTIVLPGSSS